MIEYRDGHIGEIMSLPDLFKKLQEDGELEKVKAIHFGTREELVEKKYPRDTETEDTRDRDRIIRIEEKLDRIIKHFEIYPIVGGGKREK